MEQEFQDFNPEINLDRGEQAALASLIAQPGFAVIQRIGKACVDQFVVNWINKVEDEDVLRAHKHAKVAAQFYTMLIKRINQEVELYIHTIPSDKPIDIAADLDIGEFADADNFEEEEPLI